VEKTCAVRSRRLGVTVTVHLLKHFCRLSPPFLEIDALSP
jgi:hypothetical protein